MSKKRPTRSEIESAIAGKTIAKKRPSKPLEIPSDHAGTKRRQKVLGGKLSGIGTKPKKSANLLTWVIGILAIMIIGAMLIPEPDDKEQKHQASMDAIKQIDKIYTESRIPEKTEKATATDSESFSRKTDINRATKYRAEEEKDKKLAALFNKANKLIDRERFTKPANDNAYRVYKEILKLDNSNFKAEQGIEKIQVYYVGRIEKGIKNNNLKSAKQAFESLKSMDTEADLITGLKEAITQKEQDNQQAIEQAKIDNIITQAETAYKKGNKLSPAKKNALYYYQQALTADDNNESAKKGIKQIADDYLELVNNAITNKQYEAAKGYLTTVLAINPEHPSIALLEKQITEKEKQQQALIVANSVDQTNPQEATTENAKPLDEPVVDESVVDESVVDESVVDESEVSETIPDESITTNEPAEKLVNDNQANNPTIDIKAIEKEQANIDTANLRKGLAAYYLGDYEESLRLLQPLADKGISRAQFRIGYMHQLGRGVPTDTNKADKIIRSTLPAIQKFANEGRAWAQSDLASLHDDGLVLAKDAQEAISWYEKAANQGYAGAQTNLALIYYYGKGVPSNRELAIEWFKRAAEQGDVTAKKNLVALGMSVN